MFRLCFMMFLVMAAPVVLAAPPSASESSDEVSTEDKGEEDISGKAQGMLKSLLSSFQDLTAAQASVKVSGIPSTTETGGSGSAATKAKVDSEGAPTARILGSALYPPSGGVPDNLPLVSQTHWPTTGYHKNQYSSYYPHDPAFWYRLAANGYASPYHYSPYYYEEDEYEGEDDYCPPCNCDEEKEDEDEGHYDEDDDSAYYEEDEDEYEVVHKNPYDHETDYGYDDDFYAILRSVQEEKETENAKKSRSKRSAPQPFDWHSVGGPSKFLEKHNVGYRIKNDLRKRLEEEKFPRYVGFLNTKPKHSKKHSKKPHKNHSKHHGLKKHRGPKKHHKKHSTHKKHGGHKRHHKKHGTHKKHHGFKKPNKKHSHKKQNPPPLPPPFPFPIMPEPPMVEEPMPVEPEEPGMPPMMPGDEGSGMPPMPPMMPGEEESGMPPMMPGEEESGMPPMMPGEEESGMPPMMPGEEESGMPPMMPGEEESGMPPMMSGDDMGMMSMPTPPPVNPMDGLFEEITCDENGDCFVFSCDDETGVCINAATMEVIEDPR